MKKLKRGGYGTGEFSCNHVVKTRITTETYNRLLEIQESKGFCLAYILRKFLHEGLDKENAQQ